MLNASQQNVEYNKYLKELNQELEEKESEREQKIKNAKDFKESLTLLDEIFTTAILKQKIQRVTLQDEVPLNEDAREQQELEQNELILNNEYGIYRKELENLVDANASLVKQLKLIDQAKDYLKGLVESHPESGNLKKIGEVECEDKDCFQCERYNPKICLKCKQDFSLTTETACVLECPEGQFSQDLNEILTCVECHPSCKTCESEGTNCQSCHDGTFLEEAKCVKRCQQGYFIKETNCLRCSGEWHCLTCKFCLLLITFSVKENKCQCRSCAKGLEMHQQKCLSTCQSAQYRDQTTLQCINCASLCAECFGKEVSECTKCIEGFVLQETTCKSQCDNQWANSGKGICKQCINVPNCLQYDSACRCIKCSPEYYIKSDHSQCVKKFSSCPALWYFTGYWECAPCNTGTIFTIEGRLRCAGCIFLQIHYGPRWVSSELFCVEPGKEVRDLSEATITISYYPKGSLTHYFYIAQSSKVLVTYQNGSQQTFAANPNQQTTEIQNQKNIKSMRIYDESTILYNQLNNQ